MHGLYAGKPRLPLSRSYEGRNMGTEGIATPARRLGSGEETVYKGRGWAEQREKCTEGWISLRQSTTAE